MDRGVEIFLEVAASETGREFREFDERGGEVERDWIHADPDERKGPAVPEAHVDEAVEKGEQERAPAASEEDVGRGPDFFDDGKSGGVPCVTGGDERDAGDDEGEKFFSRGSGAFQAESGEDSEQASADRGERAEDAFRVVVAVVSAAGEIDAVEVVREVFALREMARADVGDGDKGEQCPIAGEDRDERDEQAARF